MSLEIMFNQFVSGICFGSGFLVAVTLAKMIFNAGLCQ